MHCPGKWLSHQPWRYLKGKSVGDLVLVEVFTNINDSMSLWLKDLKHETWKFPLILKDTNSLAK